MGREAKAAALKRETVADPDMAASMGSQWAEMAMAEINTQAAQPIVWAINEWKKRSICTLLAAFNYAYRRASWMSVQYPGVTSIQLVRELAAAVPLIQDSLDGAKKKGHATEYAAIVDGAALVLANLYGQVSDAWLVFNESAIAKAKTAKAKQTKTEPQPEAAEPEAEQTTGVAS